MALSSIPVPSLAGGVTQQPDKIAMPDRLKKSENWLPLAERGLVKRPGTDWKTLLFANPVPDYRMGSMDLSGDRKFIAAYSHQSVVVKDAAGVDIPVFDVTRNASDVITGSTAPEFKYIDLRADNLLRSSGLTGEDSCEKLSGGSPAWAINNSGTLSGSTQAIAAASGATPGHPRSPLGWQPVPNDQTTSPESHFALLKLNQHASNTGDWSKQVNGGFPSGIIKASVYVDTSFTPSLAGDFLRLALTDTTLSTPNILYAQFVWSAGLDALPVITVDSSTGNANGIKGFAERLGTNQFRIQVEVDVAASPANSNPPVVGDVCTFSLWADADASADTGIYAWGSLVTYDGTSGEFEDYAQDVNLLKSLTVVDTTFLANPHIETSQDTTNKSDTFLETFGQRLFAGVSGGSDETEDTEDAALIFIKQGLKETDYNYQITVKKDSTTKIIVGGHTSGSGGGDDDSNAIASALATLINADSENDTGEANATQLVVCTTTGSTVGVFTKEDWNLEAITVTDSVSNTAIIAIENEVTSLGDLPITAFDGMKVKLVGFDEDEGSSPFARAVLGFKAKKLSGTQNLDEGHWEESTFYDLVEGFQTQRLPHKLVRRVDDSSGTVTGKPHHTYFEWDEHEWNERAVGDDSINPMPSFISTPTNLNRKINDIGFHNGRLIITSNQNVSMSEVNRFGNFFRTTHIALPDTERIDISASHTRESILRHIEAVGASVFFLSSQTVFKLEQGAVLSPKTVGLTPVLGIGADEVAETVVLGPVVIFATPAAAGLDGTTIQGAFVVDEGQVGLANMTDALPTFVPPQPLLIAAHQARSMFFILTKTDRTRVLGCRVRLTQGGPVPAWFEVIPHDSVDSLAVLRDELVMGVRRTDGSHMESMPIQIDPSDDNADWRVLLDRRITDAELTATRTYASGPDETTLSIPYQVDDTDRVFVCTRADGLGQAHGLTLTVTSAVAGSTTVKVSGDHTATPLYVGATFDSVAQPLDPVLRARAREGTFPRAVATLVAKRLTSDYVKTGSLTVRVNPPTSALDDTFDAETSTSAEPEDGKLKALILADPLDVSVELRNTTHKPATVDALEWECEIITRGPNVL